MNVLVIGSNGMLGYAVCSYFNKSGDNVQEITRKDFDITTDSIEKLNQYLKGKDVVINCAGVIKPRIKDNTIEDVLKVNSIFPKNLAKICKMESIKCIHITTDCVYSGLKGNYNENDFFDAEDLYGMSKNAGEPLDSCMVLRTSIIGEEKNQSRSLISWIKEQKNKSANGFINHKWNGVTTLYLAEIIRNIISNNSYKEGLYHIYSTNSVTKYDLLNIVNSIYGLNIEIMATEAPTNCDRSLSSIFNYSNKFSIKTIQQQVEELKTFFS